MITFEFNSWTNDLLADTPHPFRASVVVLKDGKPHKFMEVAKGKTHAEATRIALQQLNKYLADIGVQSESDPAT